MNRAPVGGSWSRLVRCSTIGIPAASKMLWAGRSPPLDVSFDLLEHPSRYRATAANIGMFKVPANAFIKTRSVAQLVLLVPLAIQRSLDHKLCLDVSTSTQSHDPIWRLLIAQISVRPRFGSTRHYSVAWQTASTLLPSGSRTKVP